MFSRVASHFLIGIVCATVTVALWYVYQRDFSIWLGILLFVVTCFALRRESLTASLIFAAIVTLFAPVVALFAAFVPTYGFGGAILCFPEGLLDEPLHCVDSLLFGLVLATLFHFGIRRIHGL